MVVVMEWMQGIVMVWGGLVVVLVVVEWIQGMLKVGPAIVLEKVTVLGVLRVALGI